MKKLFLTFTMVALVVAASAQDYSKKEVRGQLRAQRQQAMIEQVQQAIKARNYTFSANQITPPYSAPSLINSWNSYVEVYPNYLDVQLPYVSSSPMNAVVPPQLNLITNRYLNYQALESDGVWTIIFQVQQENVIYTFHLYYDTVQNTATLTLSPNLGNSVTYSGVIRSN